jgi:hypothetical protein
MPGLNKYLTALAFCLLLVQCGRNNDDEIPSVPVNIYLDLNINSSLPLSTMGGYIYINGGNKGIIVFHNFDDNYLAIERTCSYHPYDACNLVTVDNSGIIYKCGKYNGSDFEPCCGSEFSIEGYVNKSPATRPLRTYSVSKSGNSLHIFN